ncbi:hypothetical protein ACCAA_120010 [Candidatus Accumulibacter aalborgensis]|uniref:Uncharacterized protein n=1 Tax=Candidatus Accumulibacter aalborgensis TaxID=1860102 RepID=A0A1A8XIZ6_9PROT|nr:hypothetical protein ACCAA_120010 [Candidatus Accumulibacter aalborgensis]
MQMRRMGAAIGIDPRVSVARPHVTFRDRDERSKQRNNALFYNIYLHFQSDCKWVCSTFCYTPKSPLQRFRKAIYWVDFQTCSGNRW